VDVQCFVDGRRALKGSQDPRAAEVVKVKVKVTVRLTVSQSVCLGVEPNYGTFDQRFFFFESYGLVFYWGALSDERSGLSCEVVSGKERLRCEACRK
jgi:hypothetical protein